MSSKLDLQTIFVKLSTAPNPNTLRNLIGKTLTALLNRFEDLPVDS